MLELLKRETVMAAFISLQNVPFPTTFLQTYQEELGLQTGVVAAVALLGK